MLPNLNQGQWEFGYDLWSNGEYGNDIKDLDGHFGGSSDRTTVRRSSIPMSPSTGLATLCLLHDNTSSIAQLKADQPEMMFVRVTTVISGSEISATSSSALLWTHHRPGELRVQSGRLRC